MDISDYMDKISNIENILSSLKRKVNEKTDMCADFKKVTESTKNN